MPSAEELLSRLSGRIPMAVGSNSPSALVRQVMDGLGWSGLFVATLGTEDVDAPKPAPDLYLAGAKRCGVRIAECVIFEDSPVGTRAGMAAGAFVVTVGPAAAGQGNVAVASLQDPLILDWDPQPIGGS